MCTGMCACVYALCVLCLSPLPSPMCVCVTGVSPHLCAAQQQQQQQRQQWRWRCVCRRVSVCVCVCVCRRPWASLPAVCRCVHSMCVRTVCVSWWWCVRRGKGARTGGLLAIAVPPSAPPFPFFFCLARFRPWWCRPRKMVATGVEHGCVQVHVRTHGVCAVQCVCVCVCVHRCTPPPKS